jgi:hypothetical protein
MERSRVAGEENQSVWLINECAPGQLTSSAFQWGGFWNGDGENMQCSWCQIDSLGWDFVEKVVEGKPT